jgi:predicted NAD/FAD-binding protein
MIGCIWSCPTDQMLRFPIATLIRFCHNHGLIQVSDRPQWHTVRGGARHYVEKMLPALADARLNCTRATDHAAAAGQGSAGVRVSTDAGSERFDEVVLACHSDQSLACWRTPRPKSASAGRHPLPAQPRRAAHRHRGAAATPACLGGLELRPRAPTPGASRPPCACTT